MTDPRAEVLRELLASHARVAICGAPRTGKTTLAHACVDERPLISTDRFIHLAWGDVPPAIIARCKPLPRFLIEGVQVARALRKGLEVDAVLYLDLPRAEQTPQQASMGKSVETVFREWRDAHRTVHVVSPDLS